MNFFIFVDENSVNCIKSDGKVELLNMDYIELSFFFRGRGGAQHLKSYFVPAHGICRFVVDKKNSVALREY